MHLSIILAADHVSYINPPKYVCPRDHVKTCSLLCYKRHQQRASCNGKRDPTAFVKKEQLTTASGIDHDYNFLSGVDRVFDKADKDLAERGIGQADQSHRKRWHFDGPLQQYLRANQILIDRAPLGMSRQKANHTRYIPKSRKIVWTVEWIQSDGTKRLAEVHEAANIEEAYSAMLADKERENKKRKQGDIVDETLPKAAKTGVPAPKEGFPQHGNTGKDGFDGESQPQVGMTRPKSTSFSDSASLQEASAKDQQTTAATISMLEPQPPSSSPEQLLSDGTQQPGDSAETSGSKDTRTLILSRIQSEQSRQAALRAPKIPTGPPFFYLLRPHTSATSRVLIPLMPDQSLTASLELRTVLEFPTIYILDQGQDELPDAFLTEEAYIKKRQEEDKEVEELLKTVPDSAASRRVGPFGERAAVGGAGSDDLDPSKILEMLKRDVPT